MSNKYQFKNIRTIFNFLQKHDGSLRKKTVRSVSWVGITGIIVNTLSLIRGIILARLLTPEIFGLMSICLVVIRAFDIFTETGFYAALIQRQECYEEAKDTAFALMILRGFILAIIAILISPFVANYYQEEVLDIALKVIAITFIFGGFFNVNTVSLQKELNFKRLSYLEQAQGILNFVTVVILAYYLRSVWALVFGHVIASLLGTILSFWIIPGRPRFRLDARIAKELFHYGKFITGISVLVFVTTEIDNVIIGKILGMEALGYYVLAYTLANLPATHISKVISRVIFPAYSLLQDNLPALQNAFFRTLKIVAFLTIPAAVGLAVLAPEIVGVVYGDKWMPAVNSLVILTLFGILRSISSVHGYLYNAIGMPNISFYMNLAKLILIIMIIIPLTNRYEIVGASLAVTIPSVIQYSVGLFILRKVIGIKFTKYFNILFVPSLCSLIMALVILFVKKSFTSVNVIELSFLVVLGIFVYFALSYKEIKLNIQELRTSTE